MNYDKLAGLYLTKFTSGIGSISDLSRSLEICELVDSLMVKQVMVREEDAVLNFLKIGRTMYSKGIETCYLLYENTRNRVFLEKAHFFMERSKGIVLFRDALTNDHQSFSYVPVDFKEKELELKSSIARFKRHSLSGKINPEENEYLRNLLSQQENHIEEMSEKYPRYYETKYNQHIPGVNELQLSLDSSNNAIVQYHWSEEFLYFFLYTRDTVIFDKKEIDQRFKDQIKIYYETLSSIENTIAKKTFKQFCSSSSFLFKELVLPWYEYVSKDGGVTLILDGPLSMLPFEALLTHDYQEGTSINYRSLPYLVHELETNYSHSLRSYLRKSAESSKDYNNILAYAFSGDSPENDGRLAELPGSRVELQHIDTFFPNSSKTFRAGREAIRSTFAQDITESYDIVHLALHASSSIDDRLDNKIYFRPHNSIDSSNYLYGFEIISLNIKSKLVVLTSCQSASGQVVEGEGTYSLTRSLIQSGVESVVSSIWVAPDHSTTTLSKNFYSYLADSNPSTALSKAKVRYIAESTELTAYPGYWAGLICYGSK